MNTNTFSSCFDDWSELEQEFSQFEEIHKSYSKVLEQVSSLQKKCLTDISHHRYRIKCIMDTLKQMKGELSQEQQSMKNELKVKICDREVVFLEMEDSLPHKNGIYLSIILGQVSISLLDKADKFRYKQEYERFKLSVSYVIMFLSLFVFLVTGYRWMDALLNFLLVWYYCTLTIRESILIVNGSRIKGWWLSHHFISTVCAGISLIWPEGDTYRQFRSQYILFTLYLSFVYVLQYYYQSGCLYRLRSLGQMHTMDITVEGFMSWMWKGLAFLLPFLFVGYFFQLYNAFCLLMLASASRFKEWQVTALSIIHFFLFAGNIITSLNVVRQKVATTLTTGIAKNGLWRKKYMFHNEGPADKEL